MDGKRPFIPFPTPLVRATFIRRYKRFLADMELEDGQVVSAHCPNPGSMKSLLVPGSETLLWDHPGPTRKYRYGWKAILLRDCWVGVDTHLTNRIAEVALQEGVVKALGRPGNLLRERPMGTDSRVDLLLEGEGGRCWVEVKNVTLTEGLTARFPDAVTGRGLKHLKTLRSMVRAGDRAANLYVVQRSDPEVFEPADDIDPEYGRTLRQVHRGGVEVFALRCRVSPEGVEVLGELPVRL